MSSVIETELTRQRSARDDLLTKITGYERALPHAKEEQIAILNHKLKTTKHSLEILDAAIYGLSGSLEALRQEKVSPSFASVVPTYPTEDARIKEHAEWRDFYPVTTSYTDTPSRVKPPVNFASYKRGEDIRVFLRSWREVAVCHMMHGYIPSVNHLFSSLSTSIMALDWGDSYIPQASGHVCCLISRLLLAFGGHNNSLASLAHLNALPPNGEVPRVLSSFEEFAPQVLRSEASKESLAQLFIAKIDEAIGLPLCTKRFADFQEASEEALVLHNCRVRSRAVGVMKSHVVPPPAPAPAPAPAPVHASVSVDYDMNALVMALNTFMHDKQQQPTPHTQPKPRPQPGSSGQVCRDFLRGRCKFGKSCIHRH